MGPDQIVDHFGKPATATSTLCPQQSLSFWNEGHHGGESSTWTSSSSPPLAPAHPPQRSPPAQTPPASPLALDDALKSLAVPFHFRENPFRIDASRGTPFTDPASPHPPFLPG
jgi:hypothetical protein